MWGREPVAIAAAIRAVLLCIVAFGVKLSPEQIAAVMLVAETILALLTRPAVTANANLLPGMAGQIADAKAARA